MMLLHSPHIPVVTGLNWIVADGTDYALVAMTALDDTVADGTQFALEIWLNATTAALTGTYYIAMWSRGNVRIVAGNVIVAMKDTANADLVNVTTLADIPTGAPFKLNVTVDTGAVPTAVVSFDSVPQAYSGTPVITAGTIDFIAGTNLGIFATTAAASILANCNWAGLHMSWGGVERITATESAAGLNASFNEAAGGPAATITGTFVDA